MPRKAPADLRLRAVALAEATDVPTAAKHFGIQERTIREWMDEAPERSDLERAQEVALSEVTVRLAKGESSIGLKYLTTIAAILTDKVQRAGRRPDAGAGPSAVDVFDQLIDWTLDDVLGEDEYTDDEAALEGLDDALGDLWSELLGRANEEPGQTHRPAFLAWHREGYQAAHGLPVPNPPFPASPDLLEWCQAHVAQIVLEHGGSLVPAVAAVKQARAESYCVDSAMFAERATRVRYLIEGGLPVADAVAKAQQPVQLDPDTLALLEKAELYLKGDPS